jgi:spore germination cell wall hydrolase CwlJ-like protein
MNTILQALLAAPEGSAVEVEQKRPLAGFSIVAVLLAALTLFVLSLQGIVTTFPGSIASVEGQPPVVSPQVAPLDAATREAFAAATPTDPRNIQAQGDEAVRLNAALPTTAGALELARGFRVPTGTPALLSALECLTQAVYHEAGFEPIEGRRGVAQVVLNRVRHSAFPNSVCGVVYQGANARVCQFSFTCDGSLNRPRQAAAWKAAQVVAAEALAGRVASEVGLATHYHANYVYPYWAPKLTKLRQIGAHIFYRWPGAWGTGKYFREPYAGETLQVASAPVTQLELPPAEAPDVRQAEPRAPNDVGGRLDVSKGWTMTIVAPQEAGTTFSRVVAGQAETKSAAPVSAAAAQKGHGGETPGF